jgi:phage baseplate assembly protein gpV
MDVIPSFYQTRDVGASSIPMGGAFSNDLLRPGVVVRLIKPSEQRSRTKRFNEYDVLVQHREGDSAVTKMYHNCLLTNPLAGFADKAVWTLRPAPQQGRSGADADLSFGSQVTVLCLNGEHAAALIVGGVRNDRDSDNEALGHHMVLEFNGVEFKANDDGSWTLTNKGKTAADGTADPARDAAGAGTTVKVEANGNFEARTAGGQFIQIDHKAGKVTVNGKGLVEVIADRINHGAGADEPHVLGNKLTKLLLDIIQLILKPDHYMTVVGPTVGNIHTPEWLDIIKRLEEILSHQSFVKREAR